MMLVVVVSAQIARALTSSDPVVSLRTEKVSGSHIVSTVVVRVDMGEGRSALCVISEDRIGSSSDSHDNVLVLAQSCDFTKR